MLSEFSRPREDTRRAANDNGAVTSPRPLHVALAIHRLFPHGGLQRDALATAAALLARGHRVTILAQKVQGEVPAGVEVALLTAGGSSNHRRAQIFGAAVAAFRRTSTPDILIGFDKLPGLDLYFAGDRCYVERVHATRTIWSRWTPRYRAFRGLEEAVFGTGLKTRILLLRESHRDVFRTWYGTETRRFEVLPPGVSRSRVRPADADARRLAARESLGIPAAAPVMLFVGSDFARKGLDRAVKALASLAILDPAPWLVAAGAGDPAPYVDQARRTGMDGRFLCLGPRDDILDLMLAADVLIHPARTEAGGVVLLEALVAGTPVIASSVCGYGSVVAEAAAGQLIQGAGGDAEFVRMLTEALTKALSPNGHEQLARWRNSGLNYTASHPELFQMHAHIVGAIERAAGPDPTPR